jgi:hypothetical protein
VLGCSSVPLNISGNAKRERWESSPIIMWMELASISPTNHDGWFSPLRWGYTNNGLKTASIARFLAIFLAVHATNRTHSLQERKRFMSFVLLLCIHLAGKKSRLTALRCSSGPPFLRSFVLLWIWPSPEPQRDTSEEYSLGNFSL